LLFVPGFCSENIPLSPSLTFWRTFSVLFIRRLKLTSDLEALRATVTIPFADEECQRLLESVPPMTGGEYLTAETLLTLWEGLHGIFCRKIDTHTGSVADFLGEYRHLPLKYALEECRDDNAKLLGLLVTVDYASRKSELVASLPDSGELFSLLDWSSKEAFGFLQEIPISDEAGILCHIANWWNKKTAAVTMQVSIGEKSCLLQPDHYDRKTGCPASGAFSTLSIPVYLATQKSLGNSLNGWPVIPMVKPGCAGWSARLFFGV